LKVGNYSSDKDSDKEGDEDENGVASMLGLQSYWDATYSDELANFREHGHAGEIWSVLLTTVGSYYLLMWEVYYAHVNF